MKKFIISLMSFLVLFTASYSIIPASTAVASDISIKINGENLLSNQPPTIVNRRTLVPLRAIFEALGAEVNWENSTRTVLITTVTKDTSSQISEGCAPSETYIEDQNFTYTSYECENTGQYKELGNQLLSLIDLEGVTFLQGSGHAVWDYEFEIEFPEEEEALVTYTVSDYLLTNPIHEDTQSSLLDFQNDTALHQKHWNTFINLIPMEHHEIVELVVFAHDGTTGYVEQNLYDDKVTTDWIFAINMLEIEPGLERISTFIHEFSHLLTLGENQVTPYVSEENCQFLFLDEGCSQSDSYIQTFYEEFWEDIYEQVLNLKVINNYKRNFI
jgi:hypothetical protein